MGAIGSEERGKLGPERNPDVVRVIRTIPNQLPGMLPAEITWLAIPIPSKPANSVVVLLFGEIVSCILPKLLVLTGLSRKSNQYRPGGQSLFMASRLSRAL